MTKKMPIPTSTYKPFRQPTYQNVDFVESDHDKLISDEGYDITFEKSIKCPCREGLKNKTHVDCVNCKGSGWIYIDPVDTKAVITSQAKKLSYGMQGEILNAGAISVTPLSTIIMTEYDRLTLNDSMATVSEVPLVYYDADKDRTCAKFNYPITEIEDIFRFVSYSLKLNKIKEEDYEIDGNVLIFSEGYNENGTTISARYKYRPVYLIYDVAKHVRDIRLAKDTGGVENVIYPQLCTARLAHHLTNYEDMNLNTTET